MEKIEKIVEILKLNSLEVKRILGLPVKKCPATSVEDAREIFHEATGAEERYSSALKWMELTTSLEGADELYQVSRRNSPEEALALRTMLGFVSNFNQANEVFVCVLESDEDNEDYKGLREQALEKAILLCSSVLECRELWSNCYEVEKEKVFQAWLSLCRTKHDYNDLLSEFSKENNPYNAARVDFIKNEWKDSFKIKMRFIKSGEDCAQAYLIAPNDPKLVQSLIWQWLSFCNSEADVVAVFNSIHEDDYSACEREFVKRLYQVI